MDEAESSYQMVAGRSRGRCLALGRVGAEWHTQAVFSNWLIEGLTLNRPLRSSCS